MTLMSAEEMYSRLWQQMRELIKKLNPCHSRFVDGKFYCLRDNSKTQVNGCCSACKYFKNGCSVESLACAMWLCRDAFDHMSAKKQKEWTSEVEKLNKIRLEYNINLYYRASKEDTFNPKINIPDFDHFQP